MSVRMLRGAALLCFTTAALALTPVDSVKINELYVAGAPGIARDGFLELYNAGAQTAYLDGALLVQGLDTLGQVMYRFPGAPGDRQVPLAPGEYLVFAIDAVNFMEEYPASVNLARADFESAHAGLMPLRDNPAVPDLTDLLGLDSGGFFVPENGQILLTTGTAWDFRPGIAGFTLGAIAGIVPDSTVVDAVQYRAAAVDSLPRLPAALDSGAIVGLVAGSGQSAERASPGQDSNHSGHDFVICESPTPGYTSVLESRPRRGLGPPGELTVISVYPNPFNSLTRITFEITRDQPLELSILNVLGQPVTVLYSGDLTAGRHQIAWDGRVHSQNLPSGIYFIRLAVQKQVAVVKLALTR